MEKRKAGERGKDAVEKDCDIERRNRERTEKLEDASEECGVHRSEPGGGAGRLAEKAAEPVSSGESGSDAAGFVFERYSGENLSRD